MEKTRSPFGTLLRNHRRQLGLSQARLARRIAAIADEWPTGQEGLLSEKAISNLEAEREPGAHVNPRLSTVIILARALGLERDTPDWDAFLEAASPGPSHHSSAATLGSPFVQNELLSIVTAGREDEIQRLNVYLNEALGGAPQIVFVAGDSGIGKTFLINHFCRLAVSSHPTLVVALGDANSPAGLGEPYQPFKQALTLLSGDISAARFDQLLSVGHAERLQRLAVPAAEQLVSHGPALIGPFIETETLQRRVRSIAPSDAWWLPVLDRLIAETSPRSEASLDQIHEQVARVLLEMARDRPIVLVLDDLHWADERTCDLLFYLTRRLRGLRGVPMFVIGAYRFADLADHVPSARHPLHRVINETQRYWGDIQIDLTNTIGNQNGRLFVDALIDAEPNRLDDSFRSLLFERTEGHPLFVTELLRWMQDRGFLVRDGTGEWSARRTLNLHHLPPRIGALIAERIERLPVELQKTLRTASAQGLTFIPEVVAEVRHLSRRHLAGQLEALVTSHRLLIAEPHPLGENGAFRYRFAHSQFQEYIEGSMLPFTRQTLHIETAEAILRILPNPADSGLDVARQFELGGDSTRACEWFLQAADRALREFDHEGALRWFGHALDLAREAENQSLVCRSATGMAEALRARGDIAAAIRVGQDALEASVLAQNQTLRAECLTSLGVYFYDIGNNDQAESYLIEALALLKYGTDNISATACTAHYLLSYTLYARGAYSAGVAHAREALALARKFNFKREEGECLVSVAYFHVDLGDYAAAIRVYETALECQRAAKDLRGEAVSLLNIGLCHTELGEFEVARAPLERALHFGERMRVPRTQAFALTYCGLMQEGLHQWSEAAGSYTTAYQLRMTIGQESLAIDPLAGIVRVALAKGDFNRVSQGVEDILRWLATKGTDGIEYPIRVYLTLVNALRALGETGRANATRAGGLTLLSARAAQIADPERRTSFLERVPFNRALMELDATDVHSSITNGRPVSPDGASED